MAIRARVQHNGSLDTAVNAQQIGRIPGTLSAFIVRPLVLAPMPKHRHLTGIFGKQFTELMGVKPDPAA